MVKDSVPLDKQWSVYWRGRKKLAIKYHHFMRRFFMGYVKSQNKKRLGECKAENCEWAWLCCIGCSKWDRFTRLCKIHKNRPEGCVQFPIDGFQLWLSGMDCGYYWSKRGNK